MTRTKEKLKEEILKTIENLDLFEAQDLLRFLRNKNQFLHQMMAFFENIDSIKKSIDKKHKTSYMVAVTDDLSINIKEIEKLEKSKAKIIVYMKSKERHTLSYNHKTWCQLHEYTKP